MKKSIPFLFLFYICVTGFAQVSPQIFTSTGSFTVPSGVSSIYVEAIGAGGSGENNGGGGGGGGAYISGNYTVTPGQTLNIVIGTGGSGLASIVAPLGILANAGSNGTTAPNPNIGGGGAGGIAQGGNVANHNGGNGGGGYYTYFGGGGGGAGGPLSNGAVGGNTVVWTGGNCLTPGGSGGLSGGAPAGDGGKGAGFTDNNCQVTDPAGNGTNYGAGGGGGNGIGSLSGTGGGGYVSISWLVTGIAENSFSLQTQMFQNPFSSNLIPLYPTNNDFFELMNLNGELIWSGNEIEKNDFSALPSGIYFVKRIEKNKLSFCKVTKM